MFSMRYGIIVPLYENIGHAPHMPFPDFLFMIAAALFIGAAGYIINDYFDQKIDAINRPHKIIVGKKIHRRAAILGHWIFNIMGVLLGLMLAYRVKLWWVFAVYLLVTVVFWYYSVSLKKHTLLGNLAVSAMAFLVPFQVVLFEFAWYLRENSSWPEAIESLSIFRTIFYMILVYSIFAFFTNLIREIIKDFEDIKGDARYKRRSLPIVLGPVKAKWIVQLINAMVIAFVVLTYLIFLLKFNNLLVYGGYLTVFIVLPLVFTIIKTYQARETKQYHTPGNVVKFVMLTGILFPFLFGFFQ
jgi:4-hydroxybenzoate polyprenyltransferase